MNIEEKFNEFYNKFLNENRDNFDELEFLRKNSVSERKRNIIFILIVDIFLLVICLLAINYFSSYNKETVENIGFFCLNLIWIFPIIIALTSRNKLKRYEKLYKEKIINNLIKTFCYSLQYSPNDGINYEDFKKVNFEHFNNFYSSDLISGIYMCDEITISKIITEYDSSTGFNNRDVHYETFDGAFAKVKWPQKANIELYIKPKKTLTDNLNNIFLKDINQVSKSNNEDKLLKNNYNEIKIPELDNIFNLYSSNPELAKNIFNSEINEILIDIYNIEKFCISIKDSYIYMQFWISGLFSSPPIEKETYDREYIYKNYKMLYIIFYLSSVFKKNVT